MRWRADHLHALAKQRPELIEGADECDEAWAPQIRALPDTWPLPDTLRGSLRVPQAIRNGVFISYSHADRDDQLRSEIENGLKALGVKETVGGV